MLKIQNLQVRTQDKIILHGINLVVNPGEVHAIMGPNGSGKSTLANVLVGRKDYEVTAGGVEFLKEDLLQLSPEDRAARGLFLAFQYPAEIPGVNNMYFMKAAMNSIRKKCGETELDAIDFMQFIKARLDIDALQTVAKGVNSMRGADRAAIVITHYQRLLNYIVPDYVHVLAHGRILKSGGKELALELEQKGYGWLEEECVHDSAGMV
jgi:Fe-S cluster assembly ATP-binding protein